MLCAQRPHAQRFALQRPAALLALLAAVCAGGAEEGVRGCCCGGTFSAGAETLRRCLAGAALTAAAPGRDDVLVVKIVSAAEGGEGACAAALWATRQGHAFEVNWPVSSPGDLEDGLAARTPAARPAAQPALRAARSARAARVAAEKLRGVSLQLGWIAIVGEDVLPVGGGGSILRELVASYGPSEELHVLAAQEPQDVNEEGPLCDAVLLLRRSALALRLLAAILRESDSASAGGSVAAAIASTRHKLEGRALLLRPGDTGSVEDGIVSAAEGSRRLFALAAHAVPVRAVGAAAVRRLECGVAGVSKRVDTSDWSQAVRDVLINATRDQVLMGSQPAQRDGANSADAPEHPVVAAARLAQMLEASGRYSESAPLARAVLEHKVGELPHVSGARVHLASAALRSRLGEYDAALFECERAAAAQQGDGDASARHAGYACAAGALQAQGREAEAELRWREALPDAARSSDRRHATAAVQGLASNALSLGRLDEAEELAARALRAQRKRVGEGHPDLVEALSLLADVWRRRGRSAEALRALQSALAIQKGALRAGHPDIGATTNNVGLALLSEKRYEEGVSALREALRIQVAAYGSGHASVASTLLNLAAAEELQGKLPEAEAIFTRLAGLRSSAVETRFDGQRHGRHGKLLHRLGRHDEALDSLRAALASFRRVGEPGESAEALDVAGSLGVVLHSLVRAEESVALLRAVSSLQERSGVGAGAQSDSSARAAQTLANLGAALHATGQTVDALETLRRGEARLVEALGEEDAQVQAVRLNIAAIEQQLAGVDGYDVRAGDDGALGLDRAEEDEDTWALPLEGF